MYDAGSTAGRVALGGGELASVLVGANRFLMLDGFKPVISRATVGRGRGLKIALLRDSRDALASC